MTWKPWNPVDKKKTLPNIPSLMQKLAVEYSNAWKPVKIIARTIVVAKPIKALNFFPAVIAWWANVIVTPELSNNNVFNNGISKALRANIPFGGQIFPTSIVGVKLEAKKAQKNAKKNMTSDNMNSNIP